MMSQLGRMLTEFYFPEEADLIRRRVEPALQRGEWSQAVEDRAVAEVLGLSYEQLGIGVTKVWGLPDSLRRAVARPEGAAPSRPVESAPDRLRWCVQAAREIAQALMQAPAGSAASRISAIGERYARALNLPRDQFEGAVRSAQSHLQAMSAGLGIALKPDSRARGLMPQGHEAPAGNGNPATIVTGAGAASASDGDAATAASAGEPGGADPAAADASADATARMLALENGISSVTSALAGDSFKLNDVLRTILQTMQGALGFRCVVFGLRDPKSGVITGRFGLGGPAAALSAQFRVDVNPNGPVDLLSVACKKAADTLISDASAANVRSRLPTWLQREADARSFVLLPMTMKGAPFALIYADCAAAGGIVLGERELSLLRTLRNQAVMAFKTAG
jgi:hypothetical protein